MDSMWLRRPVTMFRLWLAERRLRRILKPGTRIIVVDAKANGEFKVTEQFTAK